MEKAKGNILVVDDEKPILQVLTRILRKYGYSVDTAETGREAIEKMNKQSYDLALIDLGLKDMRGLELLRIIGAHNPKMKKIIITGFTSEEKKARSEGADAYLVKPFKAEELLKIIQENLKTEHQ